MSKMQEIIDKALDANKRNADAEAIRHLIDAIVLLSKGEAQLLADVERLRNVDHWNVLRRVGST